MKKLATAIICLAMGMSLAGGASAAGGGAKLQEAGNDLGDRPSLQRGAKMFMNYCSGCHSAKYMRYNRIAEDLGIELTLMQDNLMFNTQKPGETIQVSMDAAEAESWFGVTPPDLSVVARSRGTDWIYSFLLSYYVDDSTATGVNNVVFENTAMPHVLWELQGMQDAVYEVHSDEEGHEETHFVGLEQRTQGTLSQGEYKRAVRDLVNFLDYVGEPAKLVRYKLGMWVILYLLLLLGATYALKKEFWKAVK